MLSSLLICCSALGALVPPPTLGPRAPRLLGPLPPSPAAHAPFVARVATRALPLAAARPSPAGGHAKGRKAAVERRAEEQLRKQAVFDAGLAEAAGLLFRPTPEGSAMRRVAVTLSSPELCEKKLAKVWATHARMWGPPAGRAAARAQVFRVARESLAATLCIARAVGLAACRAVRDRCVDLCLWLCSPLLGLRRRLRGAASGLASEHDADAAAPDEPPAEARPAGRGLRGVKRRWQIAEVLVTTHLKQFWDSPNGLLALLCLCAMSWFVLFEAAWAELTLFVAARIYGTPPPPPDPLEGHPLQQWLRDRRAELRGLPLPPAFGGAGPGHHGLAEPLPEWLAWLPHSEPGAHQTRTAGRAASSAQHARKGIAVAPPSAHVRPAPSHRDELEPGGAADDAALSATSRRRRLPLLARLTRRRGAADAAVSARSSDTQQAGPSGSAPS